MVSDMPSIPFRPARHSAEGACPRPCPRKGKEREFAFLELLEERAIDVFGRVKNNGKTVSSNVDFYSGFVYEMIGLPQEIFTPLFAMARIVGWCAHRNEELNFEGKRIIRPAYKNVLDEVAYVPIKKR